MRLDPQKEKSRGCPLLSVCASLVLAPSHGQPLLLPQLSVPNPFRIISNHLETLFGNHLESFRIISKLYLETIPLESASIPISSVCPPSLRDAPPSEPLREAPRESLRERPLRFTSSTAPSIRRREPYVAPKSIDVLPADAVVSPPESPRSSSSAQRGRRPADAEPVGCALMKAYPEERRQEDVMRNWGDWIPTSPPMTPPMSAQ